MWLEFTEDFQWTPPERKKANLFLQFRKGNQYFVRKQCGEAALAANKAIKIKRTVEGAVDLQTTMQTISSNLIRNVKEGR